MTGSVEPGSTAMGANVEDVASFRAQTRAWLASNCPSEMRSPMISEADICWGGRRFVFQSAAQRQWLERMRARGWTVPEWPVPYGGAGLTRLQAKVLREEMTALGCRPPLQSFGIWMLGPALLKYGSDAPKERTLAQDRSRRNSLVPGLFGT